MRGLRRGSSPASTPASTPASPAESADLRAAVATLDPEDTPPGKLGRPRRSPRTPRRRPGAEPAPSAGRTGRSGRGGRGGRGAGTDATTAVNLLSPWVIEELGVRTLRFRFAYAALALVVALGLAWTGLHLQAGRAQTALAGEESIGTTLTSQISSMAPVRAYVSGVDTRARAVSDLTDGQLALSQVMQGLQAALPPQASIDTLQVSVPLAAGSAAATGATPAAPATGTTGATDPAADPAAGTCPGPDPFAATDVVACLQITGQAATRDAVSTLVLSLQRSPLFAEPFVSATTSSEEGDAAGGVTFVGSVGVTAEAADLRFANLVERLGSTEVAAAAKAARKAAAVQARSSEAAGAGAETTQEQP